MEHHHIEVKQERFEFTSKMKNLLYMAIAAGVLFTALGFVTEASEHRMQHFWTSMLLAAFYTTMISLAGSVFLGIQYLTNAGWSVAFKRVPEALGQYMIIGAVVLLGIFLAGHHDLYHWTHADAMKDAVLKGKSGFLNIGFFTVSTVVFFGLYYFFTRRLRNFSLREDSLEGADKHNGKIFHACRRISGGFVVIFGFSFPVVAWEWMMSIDPHWYSTIYSIYNFALMWVCGITSIALLVIFLKRHGYLSIVTQEHLHDLGKMMFAFSIFWTYIWLAQYLLIWYANIPEESIYFTDRGVGTATPGNNFTFHFWLNLVLNFIGPLLIFMTSTAKRKTHVMATLGVIILIGHWNDLYLEIMPGTLGANAHIGFFEIGCTLLFFGILIYTTLASLAKHNLIAVGHPYLEESIHHEVAP